jgi:hypothetical protein
MKGAKLYPPFVFKSEPPTVGLLSFLETLEKSSKILCCFIHV